MKYMTIPAYNPHHAFSLLNSGVNIRKPNLIQVIYDTEDYRKYERQELIKSEHAFEQALKAGGDL